MALKYYYRCIHCGKEFREDKIYYLCEECSKHSRPDEPPKGVLKTCYDYEAIRNGQSAEALIRELEKENFLSLLPLKDWKRWPNLRVGHTPLYQYNTSENKEASINIYLKDDSQNPTFSFKDRASALVSAWAKEHGIDTIVAASTGNAGSSLAGICASQGQKSMIFVPETAPVAKLTQIMMYGARIIPVSGNYDQAFDLSVQASEKYGFYNRNTAYNPLTIEGKKTAAFEIFIQLHHKAPDRIFVPVGDGVILSGLYKGFEDLLKLGFIDKIPVMVAVQAEKSCNLCRNLHSEKFETISSETLADSISVDIPRNFHMAAQFLRNYHGECMTVSDEEIINASVQLSKTTGIFTEPAAAAAFAGFSKYLKENQLRKDSDHVILLTGSGLKDLKSVQPYIKLPASIRPNPNELERILRQQ